MFNAAERLFSLAFRHKVKQLSGIPGPPPKFPLGNALDFMDRERQPWEICADYGRKYGGITLIWIGPRPAVVLNDPRLIREVLDSNWRSYYKDLPVKALMPVVGQNNAFVINEPRWTDVRGADPMSAPGFEDWVRTQAVPMQAVVERHLKQLCQADAACDLLETMQRISFDALNEATCGVDLGTDAYDDFIKTAEVGSQRMLAKWPIPETPYDSDFHTAHERWFARFEALVEETAQHVNPDRTDLLSVLMRRGDAISKEVLRDAMATVAHGGAFSVTSAVVSALFLLSRMPSVAEKLQRELDAVTWETFDAATLDRCRYLECVLRETLRYYSPVPLYFRNVLKSKPTVLGRHRLPADTQIYITNWLIHRSEDHWERPDSFEPERWENGGIEDNPIDSDYFFPFGRGPRMCIGAPLAMLYMKLALATVLRRAEVDFEADATYRQGYFFGVMMPQGLKAAFRARRPQLGGPATAPGEHPPSGESNT